MDETPTTTTTETIELTDTDGGSESVTTTVVTVDMTSETPTVVVNASSSHKEDSNSDKYDREGDGDDRFEIPTFNVKSWANKTTTRERLLIAGVVLVAILCLGLSAAVGVQHTVFKYRDVAMRYCTGLDCYKTAETMLVKMDTAADPCTDFYRYSCGRYIDEGVLDPSAQRRSVQMDLYLDNEERIEEAILRQIPAIRQTPWAYEVKLRNLFIACIDEYNQTMTMRHNNPFVAEVYANGNSFLLDKNFEASKYDWNKYHRYVASDDLTRVFFDWGTTYTSGKEIVPIMHDEPLSFAPCDGQRVAERRCWELFESMVRNISRQLLKDAESSPTPAGHDVDLANSEARVNVFVDDVLEVERKLESIIGPIRERKIKKKKQEKVETEDKYYLLNNLNSIFPNFKMKTYFSLAFKKSQVTWIWVPGGVYERMQLIHDYTLSLSNQKLNNYLVWRTLHHNAEYMSFDYSYHRLNYENSLHGSSEYRPAWERCLVDIRAIMPDAVDAAFMSTHIAQIAQEELDTMFSNVRQSIIDELHNETAWLSDDTRSNATSKLVHLIEKLGAPEWLKDKEHYMATLDHKYRNVTLNGSGYYVGAKQLMSHMLEMEEQDVIDGSNRELDWMDYPVYSSKMSYLSYWNDLIVPAGLLHHPVFSIHDPRLPRYYTYATLGEKLALGMLRAVSINFNGADYNHAGEFQPWWSDASRAEYERRLGCLRDQLAGREFAGAALSEEYAENLARAVSEVGSSVRHAYRAWRKRFPPITAYDDGDGDDADRHVLPGVGESREQDFFIAVTQTYCGVSRSPPANGMTTAFFWNATLSSLEEFRQAFKCDQKSSMASLLTICPQLI